VEPHIGPEQEKGHRKLLKGPDHHYFEDEELSSWPSHQDQINREGRLWGGSNIPNIHGTGDGVS